MTDAADLVARFHASNEQLADTKRDTAAERRAIVNALLDQMPPVEVASALGITLARVSQIVGGIRRRTKS